MLLLWVRDVQIVGSALSYLEILSLLCSRGGALVPPSARPLFAARRRSTSVLPEAEQRHSELSWVYCLF